MKQSHLPLVIILTVLLTVTVIASVALVVALTMMPASDQPASDTTTTAPAVQSTPDTTTTTKKPDLPTTPAVTTQPVVPTPPATTAKPDNPNPPTPPATTTKPAEPKPPVTTTKPVETTPPPATDKPVETTPPVTTTKPEEPVIPTPAPGLNAVSGTVKGENVGSLTLYAQYATEEIDEEAKTMKIRFTFYIQSYSLRMGPREDNYLVVNGETFKNLTSEKVDLPDKSPLTRTQLHEQVIEIEKPDDNTPVHLELQYFWHFQGKYSGESADWLSVTVELLL